jgi:hypothetical protein
MATAKTDSAASKPAPVPEALSEEEIAAKLIETSFPDLATPKPQPVSIPNPVTESKPVPKSVPEPEVINDFYKSLGIPYCKKCGERSRTSDGENTFCPIAKPNCSGFSA